MLNQQSEIFTPAIYVVANTHPSGKGMNGQIYDPQGISPTLTTNKGEGIKILQVPGKYGQKNGYIPSTISNTVDASAYKGLGCNQERPAIVEIQLLGHIRDQEHQMNRVFAVDGVSPTLLASHDQTKIAEPVVRYRVRKLTPTEYGRLQGFPMDNWRQVVSNTQAYKQFGNAVTVSVSKAVALQIKEFLKRSKITKNKILH
ncbi:DNA cytosine methyltransferase [Brevibacillus sp. SYSU BS000544]|uniref:DNA cytosine methyltransferase n=1 Tax=Brevibacillus sp. SYSU BS000544 TaxID=3416443 RepID=UPI003CE58248